MPLVDQRRVPRAAVLLVEGDELAVRRDAGGAAGLGEQHQRQQPGHLAVVGEQRADQAGQPDRLGGQVGTHGVGVGAGREVALVEDEVQHGEHAGDAGRQVLARTAPGRGCGRPRSWPWRG